MYAGSFGAAPFLQAGVPMEVNDRRPGKTPRIRREENTVTFTFAVGAFDDRLIELSLRCERDGEISCAIACSKLSDDSTYPRLG